MAEREVPSAGRAAEQSARASARHTKALFGVLAAMLIIWWWQQDWLKAQYQWRVVMKPAVLTPEQERTLAPKSEFRECAHGCPTMVVVPAGSFTMGSPESDKAYDNERPQHEVRLAKPFAIGKFDVTFGEWDACVEAGACRWVGWAGDRPVTDVSWQDAKLYAAWLSRVTGKAYRLLTEAEWEYAARAGSKTRYFFGDDEAELGQYAWYEGNSGEHTQPIAPPVGKKKPNAFGLYDMHGNVWQWVEDCYHESYEGAPSDGSAWATGDCRRRVLRGGAWINAPGALRAATRFRFEPAFRGIDIGFRLGRTMTP
jgi:formylglycine-generating enzyme required for sulfatase activity